MADDEDFMQDDMDMADSDDDLDEDDEDEDDEDDDDDGEDMNDDAPPSQPEPVEEDIAIARRRSIQAIMRDNSISDQEKRMRIQSLMSGGRTEVAPPPTPVLPQPESSACVHYERNCNPVAPCCNIPFGCRICHDELSPPGHPPMNRFMVREVVCKLCNTRQAAS
jgi:CHY zinc finger